MLTTAGIGWALSWPKAPGRLLTRLTISVRLTAVLLRWLAWLPILLRWLTILLGLLAILLGWLAILLGWPAILLRWLAVLLRWRRQALRWVNVARLRRVLHLRLTAISTGATRRSNPYVRRRMATTALLILLIV